MPIPPKKRKKSATTAIKIVNTDIEVEDTEEAEETGEAEEKSLIEIPEIDPDGMEASIQKLLKFSTFEPLNLWLDTKSPELNAVLGSKRKGLAFNKIIEIAGVEHSGKTAITQVIAGMGQQEGAGIIGVDAENSRDKPWSTKLGLNYDQIYWVKPHNVKLKKTGPAQLKSAEIMFAEAEAAMQILQDKGFQKQICFVDSLANLIPQSVIEGGAMGQNMRTNAAKSMFLSTQLPRWAALSASYNCMIILINQIRLKPGVSFGSPEYSPGGRALLHNCSIRAKTRRSKGGLVRQNGKVVGIIGVIQNLKNKAGGGSVQDAQCGFKINWNYNPAKVSFMSRAEAEAEMDHEKKKED